MVMGPKHSAEALMAGGMLLTLPFGLLPLAWIVTNLYRHPHDDVFLLVTAAALVCSSLVGVFAMLATSWPDVTSRWRAKSARASLLGWTVALLASSMVQAIAFSASRHDPAAQIGAFELALWHLGCLVFPLLPMVFMVKRYLVWAGWRVPLEAVAEQLGGTVVCDGTALRRWLDRWLRSREDRIGDRSSPTYVMQARCEGFELALEITFGGTSKPELLLLVSAEVDIAHREASLEVEGAGLRALGVAVEVTSHGVVAAMESSALPRSVQGRERLLCDLVVEIIGLLRGVGARPLASIEARE